MEQLSEEQGAEQPRPGRYLRKSVGTCPWPSGIYPGTLRGLTLALKEAQVLAQHTGIMQDVYALHHNERRFIRRIGPDGEVALEGTGSQDCD